MPKDLSTYKMIDETVETEKVNKLVGKWSFMLAVVLAIPYLLIWGMGETGLMAALQLAGAYLLFIVLHELLHLFGYIFVGKAALNEVKLGIIWRQLIPYAHCKVPLKINHYRFAVAACPHPKIHSLWKSVS